MTATLTPPGLRLLQRGLCWSSCGRRPPAVLLRVVSGTLALAVYFCLAQLPAAAQSPSRDLQLILDAKVLRVAVTSFDLPSFHMRGGDGKLLGPEIEMARQIGTALGVQVEFLESAKSFDGVVEDVAAGRADIGISKLSQTYNRLKRVRFSEPYVTLRHAFLFNRLAIARAAAGRPPAAVLQKFSGRIGVIGGSAYVDFASRNFPAATVVEARSWDAAIESLLTGQVDTLYRDEFEIRRVLKNKPALNVQLGSAVIVDQYALLSIAICDSCGKLQQFINHHIAVTRGAFTLKGLLESDLGKTSR